MKVMIVMGARPNFIKCAPLIAEINHRPHIQLVLVHTGQHYDEAMSGVFLHELGFPELDYNLEVGSGTHGVQTGLMLQRLDPILLNERPDVVLVPGDTNSTLAGTLAAYKLGIPTGHIEAGLREDIWRPEEINKKIADHCSDFCFAPTELAVQNLLAENIPRGRIFLTGDITFDAFVQARSHIEASPSRWARWREYGDYALVTMHRAETVDHRDVVEQIVAALTKFPRTLIFPMHPRTRDRLAAFGLLDRLEKAKHVHVTEPAGYYEFLSLLIRAKLVLTDSSGVLKEAFYALRPAVLMDETNEYKEIFELGHAVLAGRQTASILSHSEAMWVRPLEPPLTNPFGNGTAAIQMLDILEMKRPQYPA